jgi:plasmid stabilization system protein ParE
LTEYRIIADSRADSEVEATFAWYERKRPGLGDEFLDELQAAYTRIVSGPLRYQVLRGGVRHASLRRFPYAVYFTIHGEEMSVFAVVYASCDPSEWQRRQP